MLDKLDKTRKNLIFKVTQKLGLSHKLTIFNYFI